MKKLFCGGLLLLCTFIAFSQNVGIGETSPAAKLTIKTSSPLERGFLLKNSDNDTTLMSGYRSLFVNGYSPAISASLTVSNKVFLPVDATQLTVLAHGESSGGSSNGSMAIMDFQNINSNKKFGFWGYLGNARPNSLSLNYFNGSNYSTFLHILESGSMGVSTYEPTGKLQVNHRASALNPTMVLYDSSASGGPNILFRNATGIDSWQIRSLINNVSNADYLDIISGNTIVATFGNGNNVGIGVNNPTERLEVGGNVRITGEVNRTSTSGSNLVPICYGNVTAGGGINSGSGNFSVAKISAGWYSITITSESYQFQLYTTTVTAVANPAIVSTGSGGGNLYVRTYDTSGAPVDNQFCFVVYKQ